MVAENPFQLRLTDDENVLSMVDHHVITKIGIRFNTQLGRQWISDACQTNVEEMEAELRTVAMRATRSGSLSMVRNHVPQELADRLRPLAADHLRPLERDWGLCPLLEANPWKASDLGKD